MPSSRWGKLGELGGVAATWVRRGCNMEIAWPCEMEMVAPQAPFQLPGKCSKTYIGIDEVGLGQELFLRMESMLVGLVWRWRPNRSRKCKSVFCLLSAKLVYRGKSRWVEGKIYNGRISEAITLRFSCRNLYKELSRRIYDADKMIKFFALAHGKCIFKYQYPPTFKDVCVQNKEI